MAVDHPAMPDDQSMQLDDELCLCFHVTLRKAISFVHIERPKRASQMSECFGAGTGCGWCRPFLRELFQQLTTGHISDLALPAKQQYARQRARYIRQGGGTPPPGATPLEPEE